MATILVADDHLHMRLLIQQVLELAEHNVLLAEDGQKALALLTEHPEVQVLILDINMPVLDGFSLLKQLRVRGSSLPIVLVTARGIDEDEEQAQALGATLLTKPFSSHSLTDLIQRLLI